MYRIIAGIVIPGRAFCYRVPLLYRSVIRYARQVLAPIECPGSYIRHITTYRYAR